MPKFQKKPVVIEAVQFTGENVREVLDFTGVHPEYAEFVADWDNYEATVKAKGFKIFTLEGVMLASPGDWIIRGISGEHYPCKPDIFEATYTPV